MGAPAEPQVDGSARARAVAALVAAATELFAERGPDGVSLREVAAHAGLNYGLIHQYVGSKEDLLRLVIAHTTSWMGDRFARARDVGEALDLLQGPPGDGPPYSRFLAWAILEGRDPKELAGASPALPRLIEMLPAREPGAELVDDPRLRAASVAALTLGWRIFGPFVTQTAGLGDVPPDELHAAVHSLARELTGG